MAGLPAPPATSKGTSTKLDRSPAVVNASSAVGKSQEKAEATIRWVQQRASGWSTVRNVSRIGCQQPLRHQNPRTRRDETLGDDLCEVDRDTGSATGQCVRR